jgi:hypothetical protein
MAFLAYTIMELNIGTAADDMLKFNMAVVAHSVLELYV